MLQFWLFFFFFNDTATTEIYTLSLHDALPISRVFPNAWTLYSSLPLKIPAQGGALPVYVADGVGINFLSLPDIGATYRQGNAEWRGWPGQTLETFIVRRWLPEYPHGTEEPGAGAGFLEYFVTRDGMGKRFRT